MRHVQPVEGQELPAATMLAFAPATAVPVRLYAHLPVMRVGQANKDQLHAWLHAFWRQRGHVVPLLAKEGMTLDAAEALRQVALRGGFWACTAAQARAHTATAPPSCPHTLLSYGSSKPFPVTTAVKIRSVK